MKLAARAVTAVALFAFAAPALPCGFEKMHTTTTSAPAPSGAVATAEKQKAKTAKPEKAKAPRAEKVTAAN